MRTGLIDLPRIKPIARCGYFQYTVIDGVFMPPLSVIFVPVSLEFRVYRPQFKGANVPGGNYANLVFVFQVFEMIVPTVDEDDENMDPRDRLACCTGRRSCPRKHPLNLIFEEGTSSGIGNSSFISLRIPDIAEPHFFRYIQWMRFGPSSGKAELKPHMLSSHQSRPCAIFPRPKSPLRNQYGKLCLLHFLPNA
jgi:hypothetical protein